MGGLLQKMPVTAVTMGIATVAIAGIPPLAGFWSKDEILGVAFAYGGFGFVLWIIGLVTALITAFYMTRQWLMVFTGEPRWESGVEPHESPRSMTVPLVVLAVFSVGAGLINTPFRLTLEHFLEPSFELVSLTHPPEGIGMFLLLAGVSVVAALAGMGIAAFIYLKPQETWERFQEGFGGVWTAWRDAYRVDDLYGTAIVAPGRKASEVAAFDVDARLVDGAVNGVGTLVRSIGTRTRGIQTGLVRNYGVTFVVGLFGVVIWLVLAGGGV